MESRILDLAKYRMKKAEDDLKTSEIMFENKKYSQSINRSYYAMFHAIRSLLALSKFDSQKHSAIISYFNHHFIKSSKIEIEYSKMLTAAFKFRNDSDYKDFYTVSRQDAALQLKNAEKFIKKIHQYLHTTNK